jgi:hypothetical protein
MRNRHARAEARERSAEGARCVALDDEQVGTRGQQRLQRGRNRTNVAVRVALAGAAEVARSERPEPELNGTERRMLTGEDQFWREFPGGKGVSQRGQLDRFGPGPNDQPHMFGIQPSP